MDGIAGWVCRKRDVCRGPPVVGGFGEAPLSGGRLGEDCVGRTVEIEEAWCASADLYGEREAEGGEGGLVEERAPGGHPSTSSLHAVVRLTALWARATLVLASATSGCSSPSAPLQSSRNPRYSRAAP